MMHYITNVSAISTLHLDSEQTMVPLSPLKSALRFVPRSSAAYASSSSSSALNLAAEKRKFQPNGAVSVPSASSTKLPFVELCRRIRPPICDRAASAVPIIEQWINEGGTVNYHELVSIVKNLRGQKRYKQALEVSLLMFEKRYSELKSGDFAIRLDLTGKVNGIEEAESFFDTIPKNLKTEHCYSSLLNCYVNARDVDKAENLMHKMRDLGFLRSALSVNRLLNLYNQTQNHEKLRNLVREIKEEGIEFDNYTFGTLFSAYAATSNKEGIDKLLEQFEYQQGCSLHLNWSTYAIAAVSYMKLEDFDKAFNLLKKSEEQISYKTRKDAFCYLMTLYATLGKKEEVMRLWDFYRKDGKIYNKGYLAIISSLLKLDDFESAVNIFEEWESRKFSFDVRILNLMIGAYCKRGKLEAVEATVNRIMNGGKRDLSTWSLLSRGYTEHGNFSKAIECIKEAITICELKSGLIPFHYSLAAIFEHLKGKGDVKVADELIRFLRSKDLLSLDVHEKLMNWIKDMESNVKAFYVLRGGDSHEQTDEVSEVEEDKEESKDDFWGKVKRFLRPFSSS